MNIFSYFVVKIRTPPSYIQGVSSAATDMFNRGHLGYWDLSWPVYMGLASVVCICRLYLGHLGYWDLISQIHIGVQDVLRYFLWRRRLVINRLLIRSEHAHRFFLFLCS